MSREVKWPLVLAKARMRSSLAAASSCRFARPRRSSVAASVMGEMPCGMLCTNTGTIGGGESVISRFGGVTTGTAGVSGIAGETSAGGAIGDVIGGVIDGAIGGVIGALSDKNAASSSGASGGKVCGGGTCGSVGCGGCGVWSGSEDGAMTGASSSGSSGDKTCGATGCEGVLAGSEPVVCPESGSTGTGADSGVSASSTGSLGVF